MKKTICAIIALSCALIIIDAAGDSDLGLIGTLESIKRCMIALPTLFISGRIGGFIK